ERIRAPRVGGETLAQRSPGGFACMPQQRLPLRQPGGTAGGYSRDVLDHVPAMLLRALPCRRPAAAALNARVQWPPPPSTALSSAIRLLAASLPSAYSMRVLSW